MTYRYWKLTLYGYQWPSDLEAVNRRVKEFTRLSTAVYRITSLVSSLGSLLVRLITCKWSSAAVTNRASCCYGNFRDERKQTRPTAILFSWLFVFLFFCLFCSSLCFLRSPLSYLYRNLHPIYFIGLVAIFFAQPTIFRDLSLYHRHSERRENNFS